MKKPGRVHSIALASALAAALGAAALPGAALAHGKHHGKHHDKKAGAAYAETNDTTANHVIVFNRAANGKLSQAQTIATGGKGGLAPEPGCSAMCPILDTDNEVIVTGDGRLVFAVNAGSNTITSFRVGPHGLSRVSVISSGGTFPNSLTVHGKLLYVLNSASLGISGFTFDSSGHMTAIAGSSQPLAGQAVPGLARQIGFDNTGRVLVVTLLGNPMAMPASGSNAIDTFLVGSDGKPSAAITSDASTAFPFGFAFDPRNHLIMSQVTDLVAPDTGDAASYALAGSGALTPISTVATGFEAPCWVAITGNGKYAYIVNTGGGAPGGSTISEFGISSAGALSLLGTNHQTPTEFAKTDVALSRNSRYLYVLVPAVMSDTSKVEEYKVASNGSLTLIGHTPARLPGGLSGLAVR